MIHMGHFFASHDVAYEAWFDADDLHIYPLLSSVDPRSLTAYIQTIARSH